ncbi:hypothetical protein [Paenibacillus sonchi]|uniref:hypothetical protein n=1 Tax=Paenibacillus sonchi TaxID=373687 RepID=UPI0002E099A1|nr:hypothetical protein [Paenibacillus sonchi]
MNRGSRHEERNPYVYGGFFYARGHAIFLNLRISLLACFGQGVFLLSGELEQAIKQEDGRDDGY